MEIIRRLKAPTPTWFKKIRRIGLTCVAVATALMTLNASVPSFVLPSFIMKVCTWMLISGTTATVIAQTATNDDTK